MIENIIKTNILAAVIILLTVVLSRLLKNKFSVLWKYIVWLVVALFLLIPVNLFIDRPIVEVNIPDVVYETQNEAISETLYADSSENLNSDVSGSLDTDYSETPYTDFSAESENQASQTMAESSTSSEQAAVIEHKLYTEDLLRLFGMIWLTGIACFGAYNLILYVSVRKTLQQNRTDNVYPLTKKIYSQSCSNLEIKKRPALYINHKISTPILSGIIMPCLYLPDVYYDRQELDLIFAHELYHYKYKDLLYKALLMIVKTIYWFNPALYIMFREADRDLEYLCDSRVIKYTGSAESRSAYGKLLLKTASEGCVPHSITAGLNDGVLKFKERITYMLSSRKLKKGIPVALLLSVILVSSSVIIGCSVASDETDSTNISTSEISTSEVSVSETADSSSDITSDTEENTASSEPIAAMDIASNADLTDYNFDYHIDFSGYYNLSDEFELSDDNKYFMMIVNNLGYYDIQVSIDGNEFTLEPGAKVYYSASEFESGTYSLNFETGTDGAAMIGDAYIWTYKDAAYQTDSIETADAQTQDSRSPEDLTPVTAQYQVYIGEYIDPRSYGNGFEVNNLYENPNVYKINVSSVDETSFVFSILHKTWSDSDDETIIENATATFVRDGTIARYVGDEYDLLFTFPNGHQSLPVVTEIKVTGFEYMNGIAYSCGDIPGYEFG